MRRSVVLIVLDGWGIGRDDESNPIYVVKPENFKWLGENYPVTSLQASGINVGLPWGETGNSEVGHLTLGAGKIVYQYYPKITLAIRDKSFFKNKALWNAVSHAKKNNSAVNFVGLLSKGNIHASLEQLLALITLADQEGVRYKLHLFADGKDTPPRSIESFLKEIPTKNLATLTGRYYAMDREQNWYLTKTTYDTLTAEKVALTPFENLPSILAQTYKENGSEEFLPSLRFMDDGAIGNNDAVVFFNFREDSIRQLAEAFLEEGFAQFPVKQFGNLFAVTMTKYKEGLRASVAFSADRVVEPLGKVLSDQGKNQLRLAETYKYAHVTYFFNGHQETPFKNEYRVLVPSLAGPHNDEHPQMMASAITDRLLQAIENNSFDFILANYANADTIAHTGNYKASLEAVKVLDQELGRILKSAISSSALVLITADHGNIEEVINPLTGRMETQHDPNPVPLYLLGPEFKGREFPNKRTLREPLGLLSDVAPTILSLMDVTRPEEMTGHDLTRELL